MNVRKVEINSFMDKLAEVHPNAKRDMWQAKKDVGRFVKVPILWAVSKITNRWYLFGVYKTLTSTYTEFISTWFRLI